jgi:hypothetical protein
LTGILLTPRLMDSPQSPRLHRFLDLDLCGDRRLMAKCAIISEIISLDMSVP